MTSIKQLAKKLFKFEARMILRKYHPKIIAITGSVGKTTTRDFLYAALSKKFFVRKSEKSVAGLGIPLTIIGYHNFGITKNFLTTLFFGLKLLFWKSNYPAWLILEIDADKPGDVESVSDWLPVDILVVTAIGNVPAHIEAFGSDMQKFLAEKKKLLGSVHRDGVIIYNSDDETACRLVAESPLRKISCGVAGNANVRGSEFEILSSNAGGISKPTGMKFEITSREHSLGVSGEALPPPSVDSGFAIIMDTIGAHNEYAALLSVAVADLLDVPMSESVKAIEKSAPLSGRMKIIAGVCDSTVLDDSYNSSPIAARMAVETFARVETSGRKIAVIGDMLELGKFSAEEHRELGRLLAPVAQYAVCVGLRARRVAETMLLLSFDEEKISCFDSASEAGEFLQNFIQPGDLILVKGSQAMRLEKTVEQIMRHPEDTRTLLVRQEPEWLSRD